MKRNRAKCNNCGDVIESIHRHDYVTCTCYKDENSGHGIMIDGGNQSPYCRMGERCKGDFIRLTDE